MKLIIRIATFLILATITLQGIAQSNCNNITAVNSLSLSNPTYSLNPGGITSSSPIFTMGPNPAVNYTVYVTGTNTNSAIVTTSYITSVALGPTFSLSSTGYSLGCGSASLCSINIMNANTVPVGGAVTFTVLAPGSSTSLPIGLLSINNVYTVNSPGSWSVGVRDNINSCTTWSTVTVSMNNAPPVIGVSISQNPLSCSNPTALIQATPNAAVQYNWLPASVQSSSITVSANLAAPTQSILTVLTLVATDLNNLCQATSIIPVYQNVAPPTASISTPLFPVCQSTLLLTNQSFSGILNGTFPTTAAVVGLLWEGPSPQVPASLSSTYLAQTSGIYTLTAMDLNNGCTSTAMYNVALLGTAAFAHTITGGSAVFNNTSVGTTTSTIYLWDFGDGNTSTLENPTHTYTNGGSHIVKFKITVPGTFCADSVIQSITISGVACNANSNFSMVPTATAQVWDVVPSYPWNVSAATWSWGDGSSSNTLYSSHQYASAGMYNICLSVTVSCVASSSTCTTYSVYRASQQAMILQVNVKSPDLVTGIASIESNGELFWNIAPNPNGGEFNLNINAAKSDAVRIVITDLTGRIVHEQSVSSGATEISVNTSHLLSGMYLVTLQTKSGKASKRMVISH